MNDLPPFPQLDSASGIPADAEVRLRSSRVLVVGLGGLGSPVVLALAQAGVGALVLVDFDNVDPSNLQRQVIFSDADVGTSKSEAAAARVRAIDPSIEVTLVNEPFGPGNAERLVAGVDVVIDGTDNFTTRYLVNDACVIVGRPNVFGSVSRFDGQVAVFSAPGGPCYRCLHPEPPPDGLIPSCAEGGVLGVLPGVVGALQAVEAVKIISGIGQPLIGRLLLYDALRMRVRDITLSRDPECPACGDSPVIRTVVATGPVCVAVAPGVEIGSDELREWRDSGRPHMLVDVRERGEHEALRIEQAVLVPIGELGERFGMFPLDRPVVVHCRTGRRSARAVEMLRARGVDARSLAGGIEAWQRSEAAITKANKTHLIN